MNTHSKSFIVRDCACCSDQPTVPPDCPACHGAGGFTRYQIADGAISVASPALTEVNNLKAILLALVRHIERSRYRCASSGLKLDGNIPVFDKALAAVYASPAPAASPKPHPPTDRPPNRPGSDKPCFFIGSTGYDCECTACGRYTSDFERNDFACPWEVK